MTKREFAAALWEKLSALPEAERAQTIDYYMEMLEERMEEGMTEEEAIAATEPVDVIAERLLPDMPAQGDVRRTRRGGLFKVMILLLSPVWLTVLLAALVVVPAAYVTLWAVVLSVWAMAIGLIGGGVLAVVAGPFQAAGQGAAGWYTMGAGLAVAGCGFLLIIVSAKLTLLVGRGSAKGFGWMLRRIRRRRCGA